MNEEKDLKPKLHVLREQPQQLEDDNDVMSDEELAALIDSAESMRSESMVELSSLYDENGNPTEKYSNAIAHSIATIGTELEGEFIRNSDQGELRVEPIVDTDGLAHDLKAITFEDFIKKVDGDEDLKQKALSSLTMATDISDTESYELFNFLTDISKTSFKGSMYDRLPKTLKSTIAETAKANSNGKVVSKYTYELLTAELVQQLKSDLQMEKAIHDMNVQIKEEMDKIPDFTNSMIDSAHTEFVTKMNIALQAAKDNGLTEKAELIQNTLLGFDNSFSLKPIFDFINRKKENTKRGEFNKYLNVELKKYQKYCKVFDDKYRTQVDYNITTSALVNKVLLRVLGTEYDMDDVEKLVLVFFMTCKHYLPMNPVQHAYMFYFINNIYELELVEYTGDVERTRFINNVKEAIKLLKEV